MPSARGRYHQHPANQTTTPPLNKSVGSHPPPRALISVQGDRRRRRRLGSFFALKIPPRTCLRIIIDRHPRRKGRDIESNKRCTRQRIEPYRK